MKCAYFPSSERLNLEFCGGCCFGSETAQTGSSPTSWPSDRGLPVIPTPHVAIVKLFLVYHLIYFYASEGDWGVESESGPRTQATGVETSGPGVQMFVTNSFL